MTTKKITIEVEVPEGVDVGLFRKIIQEEATRITKLLKIWEESLPERPLTQEEEKLLREIKKKVAWRSEG